MAKTAKKRAPRTAYELLARVARYILEEPKRYYQGSWVIKGKRAIRAQFDYAPECGTVCCRAGWIVALHDGLNSRAIVRDAWQRTIERRADEILDMSGETVRLFDGRSVVGKPGTREYAREGARGIREFMAEHEAHLKARKLADVPKA